VPLQRAQEEQSTQLVVHRSLIISISIIPRMFRDQIHTSLGLRVVLQFGLYLLMMVNLKNQRQTSVNIVGQEKREMLYIAIVAAQNWNKWYKNQVSQITMGRRNNKRIVYNNLREKKRSKRDSIERNDLEKIEKANYRRKLKVRIKLKLKKLTRLVNLKFQYFG